MSFSTVSVCVNDSAFTSRINACIVQEQLAKEEPIDPGPLQYAITWAVAAADDVEAAYASALAAENPNPGGDESVIPDAMILSHVQANWPATATP